MFEFVHISWLWFILAVIIAVIVMVFTTMFVIFSWSMGKPLQIFFSRRLDRLSDPTASIFEIFTIDNFGFLEPAKKETGGAFRRLVKDQTTKGKLIESDLTVIPQSTYIINSVETVPLLESHPPLHKDIRAGIEECLRLKTNLPKEYRGQISTYEELVKQASETPKAILFGTYTYENFLKLYEAYREKYTLIVTVADVHGFVGKNFDKNFRETIEAKNYNVKVKSTVENKYTLYGYIAILLVAAGVAFKLIYSTIYG